MSSCSTAGLSCLSFHLPCRPALCHQGIMVGMGQKDPCMDDKAQSKRGTLT